jgi:hypothetical protein
VIQGDDDEEQPHRVRNDAKKGVDFGQTLEKITALLERKETSTQRAIKLLQEEYSDRLSLESLLEGSILFETASKADAFLSLSGKLRDMWLERSAGVQLDDIFLDID